MGYTAYQLSTEAREKILAAFPPRYAQVDADHITVDFGVASDHPLPPRADIRVIGRADDGHGIEALTVSVNGATARPDGRPYHITLSFDPGRTLAEAYGEKKTATYQAVHSNRLIELFGPAALPQPMPIGATPAYCLTSGEKPVSLAP